MRRTFWILIVTLIFVIFLNLRELQKSFYDNVDLNWLTFHNVDLLQSRVQQALKGQGDIVLGAVGAWERNEQTNVYIWQGIELATTEINAEEGIFGRRLKIVKVDDQDKRLQAQKVAFELTRDFDMIGVIGHKTSDTTLEANVIYEQAGMITFSPTSTSMKLSTQGSRMFFRGCANSLEYASHMANYIQKQGIKKMVLINEANQYSDDFCDSIDWQLRHYGIQVLERFIFDKTSDHYFFKTIFDKFTQLNECDGLFMVYSERFFEILQYAKEAGLDVPVFTSDVALYQDADPSKGLDRWNGVTFCSGVDESSGDYIRFQECFVQTYGFAPDEPAFLGYQTTHLFVQGIKTAGTTHPFRVAEALRTYPLKGIIQPVSFLDNGDIRDPFVAIKKIINGEIQIMDSSLLQGEPELERMMDNYGS